MACAPPILEPANGFVSLMQEPSHPVPERTSKRIHVALPIRVTCWDRENKASLEVACTYDISERGARVGGVRGVRQAGDIIAVERGRNKAFCRVVWIGEANSELRGQIGIECVEVERNLWEAELRQMKESYDPIVIASKPFERIVGSFRGNRRRFERFDVDGVAEVSSDGARNAQADAVLRNLSELGCLLGSQPGVLPGAELRLVLNVDDYDLCLRGQVRHAAGRLGMGIEFREIRKGDRQILQFLLRKLAEKHLEDQFQFEAEL
jgi:PilZ domain